MLFYLFNLRPGVLIKTLSHIWGRLNLPMLLLSVGLLTLMKMDSLIYLDKYLDHLSRYIKEPICCLSAIPSDLMKSTAVDESLSLINQQFCSRENQLLQLLQQNEKST